MRNKIIWLFALMLLTACTNTAEIPEGDFPLDMSLSSPAFQDGSLIPEKYTCEGQDISPPLIWSDIPHETGSLALIVDDPDAPLGTWVHWVVFNLPSDLTELTEASTIPGVQGLNDFKTNQYGGPCPPGGSQHRYYFKLYALDTTLDLDSSANKKDLVQAMDGHILDRAEIMGTFSR
jgi:Raf kinase inhibitor-like YbhB/YbcL family protein